MSKPLNTNKKAPVANADATMKKLTYLFWFFALMPFLFISGLLLLQSEDDLPPVSWLDNPPEVQASLILARKNEKEDPVETMVLSTDNLDWVCAGVENFARETLSTSSNAN